MPSEDGLSPSKGIGPGRAQTSQRILRASSVAPMPVPSRSCQARLRLQAPLIAERGDPLIAEERLPIIHLVFSNLKTCLSGFITARAASTSKPTSTSLPSASTGGSTPQRLPIPPRNLRRCHRPHLRRTLGGRLAALYIKRMW